ncbi:MAG: penicillin-binding protein [Pseudomonadota bacterium]|jgi:penicillin-binding protein 1C
MTWPLRGWHAAAAGVLLGVGATATALATTLPSYAELRAAQRPSDLLLRDRRGEPLQTLRLDPTARRLGWVGLDDFSVALRRAVVLSEDRRFEAHAGIDWSGLARSAWANLGGSARTQGASTITMQLAGLIEARHARPASGRGLTDKLAQMAAARELEARWRKPELLEAYLNLVPLRGELVGVPAAARLLFGKAPSGLDAPESAVLAALIRAPNAAPARVAARACELLKQQQLPCSGVEALTRQQLTPRALPLLAEPLAPHYARAAWRSWQMQQIQQTQQTSRAAGLTPASLSTAATPPAELRTPLDARLQRSAVASLRRHLAELSGRNAEDGAVIVLDNASGAVLAWVGSSGSALSEAPQVDAVLARRQPGSTLKPFVYQLAFERRLLTPASLIEDAPTALPAGVGLYLPHNYDRQHHGWVSARTALASSLNIPAVKVGVMLTPDALFRRLNDWGLALAHSAGWHGNALALGSAEVTLLDLTNAYRALANGGRWTSVQLLDSTLTAAAPRQVGDARAAYLVGDILADNTARVLTFGFDSPLVTRGWAMVKTGTSKDMRDNWCIGSTARYTVGVWIGNASGTPMHGVSGVSGAAPIWRELVQQLHAGSPSLAPAPPVGVLRRSMRVNVPAGRSIEARLQRDELFIAGTEPPDGAAQAGPSLEADARAQRYGIRQPTDGSIFALDPDMPAAVQRLVFEGEAGEWWLDGRRLGGGTHLSWAPWPGRHRLELRLGGGRVERVGFEVRGALARPAGSAVPKAR